MTEQIERGRGKKKACVMLPRFCPFCAAPYQEETALERGADEVAP